MPDLQKPAFSRIVIERTLKLVTITVLLLVRVLSLVSGQEVDKLKEELKITDKDIQINIFEVKNRNLML